MNSFHPRPAIRGAVYIPARAFNAAQMWRHYDGAEVRRDLGYARTVHLNALRVWVSYEYWRMEPDRFARAFEDFLAAAAERGLGVLPSLFENCGVPPTEANLWNADLRTAMCVQSPDRDEVMRRPERWDPPGEFVDWFMGRHGDDARLVGVEVVNEPGPATAAFARAMFRRAAARRGRVPLTIGSVSLPDNAWFLDLGMDTLQYHDNFPPSVEDLRRGLDRAVELAGIVEKPVWLTEVQRVRTVSGWGDQPVPAAELGPDLASVLPAVQIRRRLVLLVADAQAGLPAAAAREGDDQRALPRGRRGVEPRRRARRGRRPVVRRARAARAAGLDAGGGRMKSAGPAIGRRP